MEYLDDLIRYENENTRLDFKAVQYTKPMFEALVKDIMAMANASVPGDRYIVVGVKHRPDGSKEYLSIDEKDFIDSATYHQLIRDNVEPEIHFDYSPYHFEGHLLGVFRIYDCEEQPYMMRKDFSASLRRGDAFIRKGSHQPRMVREDLDRIIKKRMETDFSGVIRIAFDSPGTPAEISLSAIRDFRYPSDVAAAKIRQILAARAQSGGEGPMTLHRLAAMSALRATPYEGRDTETLKKNLEKVKETYREADLHTYYELHSAKVNFTIVNEGQTYVEDASISVEFPKVSGLAIAPEIYPEPEDPDPFGIRRVRLRTYWERYPTVTEREQGITVKERLGDLRHGLPKRAFENDLRIVLGGELAGETIELRCRIYGKQLRTPRVETLKIHVVPPG
ncbi:MAG TPA: ATP-binding protein [Pyrinomonadaceae bacterium]|jgi:hypothetical protein|nr:ATP-binding protein [Pyrinomonadaceae bacterium]